MTNSERYHRAFGHIHAPKDAAARAEAALDSTGVRRRRPLKLAAVLAAVLALLLGTAGAELADGAVSNLLAPLYGGVQTEIVDSIGYPVNASVTNNGYTLTADAVIGDRHNIAVVFTLTRDDGQPLPEGLTFDDWESNAFELSPFGGGGSGYGSNKPDPEHPDRMQFTYQWTLSGPILLRNFQLNARNLGVYDEQSETFQVLAEGEWNLSFTLRYRDATVPVPVDGLTVTGPEGDEFEIKKLELSPVGLHIDAVAPNPHYGLDQGDYRSLPIMPGFQVLVRLTDGTEVDTNRNCNMGGGGRVDAPTMKTTYDCFFDTPIPLEDIEAIVICGTDVPVD